MTVKEGFWGESERRSILVNYYDTGQKSEAYMTGTMNLDARVEGFFDEYFEQENYALIMKEKLKNLA
jgi:hypothetical protein